MAKLQDIIAQLQAVLPQYTDYFNETLAVSAVANVSGSTFQITTSAVHGLTTGWYVNVENVLVKNPVTTITDLGSGQVKLKTNVTHDLTENFNLDEQKNHTETVYLSDFTNLSDDFYDLVSVPCQDQLIVSLPSLPSGSGNLGENRIDGILGRFQITVIDTTNFTIAVPTSNFTTFILSGNEEIIKNIRVSGIGAPPRIKDYYSTQLTDDFWAIVVNGVTVASFDRSITSDANQRKDTGDDMHYELNQPFFVYVFAPTRSTFGAREISDLMVDIRTALCKSLCGVQFDSGFSEAERFLTTFLEDGFFDYVGENYIHQFQFETVYNFNPGDAVDPSNTRAFREFELNFKMQFDEYTDDKKLIEGEVPC